VKQTHHCVRAIYSCKMKLRLCLVEYEQSSIESVRLDRLAHTPVCKIESCLTTQELRMRMKCARKLSIFYYVWKQNRRQKVVNRGLYACAKGLTFVQGGLDIQIGQKFH